MLLISLFIWSFLLPLAIARARIEAQILTSTTSTCTTSYGPSSFSIIPTSTLPFQRIIELSPIMLHNETTSTSTYTPKPSTTWFSQLEVRTKYMTKAAVNGTLDVESTKLRTSTDWRHYTVTVTETKYRYFTSRTTEFVSAPTGFLPVRNTTGLEFPGSEDGKSKDVDDSQGEKERRQIGHPHFSSRAQTPSREEDKYIKDKREQKHPLKRPTSGQFPTAVNCIQELTVHTTEVVFLSKQRRATVTASRETFFKTKTVWGTVTSTVLDESAPTGVPWTEVDVKGTSGSGAEQEADKKKKKKQKKRYDEADEPVEESIAARSTADPTSPATTTSSTTSSTPTTKPYLMTGKDSVVTNIHFVTKTAYTITLPWTATSTTTVTSTRHATTTVTSSLACSTQNLLGMTGVNLRINGLSIFDTSSSSTTMLTKVMTETAGLCCEECLKGDSSCAWSVWEATGKDMGACYLFSARQGERHKEDTDDDEYGEDEENHRQGDGQEQGQGQGKMGVCKGGQKGLQGGYGYSRRLGEERYVVSNGACGFLSQV